MFYCSFFVIFKAIDTIIETDYAIYHILKTNISLEDRANNTDGLLLKDELRME